MTEKGSFGSSDEEESSEEEENPKKSKKIGKPKRTRNMNSKSKWTDKDMVKYWKFFLVYQIKNPEQNLSWTKWKIDSIYKHMAEFVEKSPKQCKSKDQNMKRKFYPNKDISEMAIIKLQEFNDESKEKDDEIETIIRNFKGLEKQDSEHMRMLEEKLKLLERERALLEEMMRY
jgi:hypothetical protein